MAFTQDNRVGKLSTDLGKDALLLLNLSATERLSTSYTVTIEAYSETAQPIHTLLGTAIGVSFASTANPNLTRDFAGVLWEYSELGAYDRGFRYRLVLKPDTEFLTLNRRNRIFQAKSVVDIVKSVLTGTYQADLNATYAALDYCVQYQESDFAFISRLMEYEGIYYYYAHDGSAAKLVMIDNANAHPDLEPATVTTASAKDRRGDAPVWNVTERRGLGPAKVTVADYDFEAPATKLLASKAAAKVMGGPTARGGQSGEGSAGAWSQTAEMYDFPAKYTSKTTAKGEHYGTAWLDAHRRRMARSFAEGELFAAAVGRRVTLQFEGGASTEYLIVATTHDHRGPDYHTGSGAETFACALELMPATDQYRPALVTPRPRILGPQTAIVVGPSGEEIYTDEYGRIKIQFFWDREGKNDENAGCFIRVVQAGAGQGWGSFALPRIGQEVVVDFLDGDPDRPLVTGAVYNATNTVPEALPANKTQFGLKTRITKGGGGHNRLWFEDKKDSEVVWFRAERDYKANIVNKDEERQYDKGNRKTTFMEGNDELVITKGTRTETIEGDDTKTIKTGNLTDLIEKGDETHTVKAGKRTTVVEGNETLEVKTGNRAVTVATGNDTLTVSTGNVTVKVDTGKHATDAAQAIELTCGGSSIKLDPMSITLKSTNITIDATGALQQNGLTIDAAAKTMNTIKGVLVKIN